MAKRIVSLFLIVALLFTLGACKFDMRGKIFMLDSYKPEALYKTYELYASGEREVQYTLGEEKPSLRACVMNKPGIYSPTLDIYVINESRFDILIHGYAWATDQLKKDNTCQAIYYNQQKHVSNASYEIHMDTMHNDYLSFEVLNDEHMIATSVETMAFIFFKYEDTEYVGGMKTDGNFIYWPVTDTVK